MKKISVLKSPILSRSGDNRYVVLDAGTGEVLDDAQGYGYKTAQKARTAYAYKNRDRSKDVEKAAKRKAVKKWCKENASFVRFLEDEAFDIAKGRLGEHAKFDAKRVKREFIAAGYTDLPFTAGEFLKYW